MRLTGQIKHMRVNDIKLVEPKKKYKGEIKTLFDSFNDMFESREQMKEEMVALTIRAKDAELLSLQAQINPHFT